MKTNYISAANNYKTDSVMVWERTEEGRRTRFFDSPYYFYVPDAEGEFNSMYGDKLSKLSFNNRDDFDNACKRFKTKFESDFAPLDKVLMDNYYGVATPKLNYALLDIEVDVISELGWSSVENPYAPVNAITIFKQWSRSYVTLVIPPKKWAGDADALVERFKPKTRLILCEDERELLTRLLLELEDADIISGWNSDFFDLPYLVKRTEMTLGKESVKQWCFPGAPLPRWGSVKRFGIEQTTVTIYGRTHLDYLQLFKKFTFEGRSSYSLAAIAEEELDIPKLDFEGTFEELYNNDFEHFIEYNFRDTEILEKLDEKYNFIALANQMAHENTVLLMAVMGTVKIVETGVTNFAHHQMGLIVKDKELRGKGPKVEGAIVINPKVGLHKWIGSFDITSLYPNTQRSLNISPEKIIGQFTKGENDWRGIYSRDNEIHILELDDGTEPLEATGAEWKDILKAQCWAVSGFGTVFNQDAPGIIPSAIKFWFTERKRLQGEKKKHAAILKELQKDPITNAEQILIEKHLVADFDLRQLTMKIFLNSGYGALLNEHYRFGDPRMGASTTGSGRQIATFMNETIGEMLTGQKVKLEKIIEIDEDGEAVNSYITTCPVILTGDTDSCYAALGVDNYDDAVALADEIGVLVNDAFPAFMADAFCCQPGFDTLIKAGREVVAERGMFIAKKKYVLKVVNNEGDKCDKLKSMGMETKKSDTPKVIQKFLTEVITIILNGGSYVDAEDYILKARKNLTTALNLQALGIPKAVNKLDTYYDEYVRIEVTTGKRVKLPGHVRAACNYNAYASMIDGNNAQLLRSGDKAAVFYLMPNEHKFKSIAIPVDLKRLPHWLLRDFRIDKVLSEQKMIDSKLKGIFTAVNWEIPTDQTKFVNSVIVF